MLTEEALRTLLEEAHLKGYNEGAFQQQQYGSAEELRTWDDTGDTDERDDYLNEVLETV